MKIKTKILIPSLGAVGMLLLLGCVSYVGMRSMQTTIDEMATKGMQHSAIVNEARTELLQANVGAYRLINMIANFDAKRIAKDKGELAAHWDGPTRLLTQMRQRDDVEQSEKDAIAALQEPLAKYRKTITQAIDLAESDPATGAGMMQAADKRFLEIDAKLVELLNEQKREAEGMVERAVARASSSIAVSVAVFVFSLAGSVIVSLMLAGKIVTPLLEAIRTARSIAGGNLANPIDTSGADETGDLLRALDGMQTDLRALLGQINANARKTVDACTSMAAAFDRISQSVNGQNDATSAAATAVEQMSASIRNIHDSAKQALSANQTSAELADAGVGIIQSASDEMMKISQTIRETAGVVERVGEQSKEISMIVGVIREVADQTNLLALNAAIEAARAGDAGRGFAVVADEVRKLAEKTTSSAEEITRMITGIQDSSNCAVTDIHQVVAQVETTAGYATNARESIERIHGSSVESKGFAQEISSSLSEESKASDLIAQQVEGITRMSMENAESVRRAEQAMHELEDQSHQLQTQVQRFRV